MLFLFAASISGSLVRYGVSLPCEVRRGEKFDDPIPCEFSHVHFLTITARLITLIKDRAVEHLRSNISL